MPTIRELSSCNNTVNKSTVKYKQCCP